MAESQQLLHSSPALYSVLRVSAVPTPLLARNKCKCRRQKTRAVFASGFMTKPPGAQIMK